VGRGGHGIGVRLRKTNSGKLLTAVNALTRPLSVDCSGQAKAFPGTLL
jgi:hypothetical protein